MFDDVKCVKCKRFNPYECLCEIGLNVDENENCNRYEENAVVENEFSCLRCKWHENGECIFDFDSPKSCNRFKMAKEDD